MLKDSIHSFGGGAAGAIMESPGDETPQFITEANPDSFANNYFQDNEMLMDQREFFISFDN